MGFIHKKFHDALPPFNESALCGKLDVAFPQFLRYTGDKVNFLFYLTVNLLQ